MHTLQKRLDGTFEAAVNYSAKQLIAVTDDDLQSRDRVKVAWVSSPTVQAFIRNACEISVLDEMAEAYIRHLDEMPAFETFARQARKGTDGIVSTPAQREASAPPRWYQLYRQSQYWKRLVMRARDYYGGCVLCSSPESPECHHRHYLTLGAETMKDLSILCANHHKAIMPLLGIRTPRQCPDNVEVLLHRWGLLT